MIRLLTAIAVALALTAGALAYHVRELHSRIAAIELRLTASGASVVIADPSVESPAERRARYERLAAAWQDGRAAGEYLKRRGAIADRAPRPTP
jgi:hypothetical protein